MIRSNLKLDRLAVIKVPINAIATQWERSLAQMATNSAERISLQELDAFVAGQPPDLLSPSALEVARQGLLRLASLVQQGQALPAFDAPPSAASVARVMSGKLDRVQVDIAQLPDPYWQKTVMFMADANRDGKISAAEFDAFARTPALPEEVRSPDIVASLRQLILFAADEQTAR